MFNRESDYATKTLNSVQLAYHDDFLDAEITTEEVCAAILSMKNNRSPGYNGIPTEMYKNGLDTKCINGELYCKLFNIRYVTSNIYRKTGKWGL